MGPWWQFVNWSHVNKVVAWTVVAILVIVILMTWEAKHPSKITTQHRSAERYLIER